jgi:tRNA-2-methylthio-N6-dimethylallyladenosine synthase
LIENTSKRSEEHWSGRNSQNKVVVFPKGDNDLNKGDYVMVKVTSATSGTLLGEIVSIYN